MWHKRIALGLADRPCGAANKAHPYINDLTTDTESPPQFSQPLSRSAVPGAWLPPAQAFARARVAAQALGWEVVAADQGAGRIEALATTFWFGFKDDIAVQHRAHPDGERRGRAFQVPRRPQRPRRKRQPDPDFFRSAEGIIGFGGTKGVFFRYRFMKLG